jgi:hypothetical protein
VSQKISDILSNIIPADVAWKLTLLRAWPEIIGDLADKVTIFSVENDHLILQTSHSAWAQELNFLAPLILEKINTLLGAGTIRSISFKIIKRRPPQTAFQAGKNTNTLHSAKTPAYAMTKQETSKLDSLQDEQLRKALRDYLLRTKARV